MDGNAEDAEVRGAQLRRMEAERTKLELEAAEIRRRLDTKWWNGDKLPRYAFAILLTSVVLFGWAKGFVLPILQQETELNKYAVQVSTARNAMLQTDQERLTRETAALQVAKTQLTEERDKLTLSTRRLREQQQVLSERIRELDTDRRRLREEKAAVERARDQLNKDVAVLKRERDQLRDEQRTLQAVVGVMKNAVAELPESGRRYFSILNSGDPINHLSSKHNWKLYSDNYEGWLGYYLVASHPSIPGGKRVLIGRTFEVDDLKRKSPDSWQTTVKKVASQTPILALDYTYVGLLSDGSIPVGGTLYTGDGRVVNFYAPLSEWDRRLAEILR